MDESSTARGPVLLISGSTRKGSMNTAAPRTIARLTDAVLFDGLTALPHVNPDDDVDNALPEPVSQLRQAIGASAAVLFCTPEHAGALPGSFKNLLDWTVGGEVYRKRVAWINVSPHGAADANDSLTRVLAKIGTTVVAPACQHIPVTRADIAADGTVTDSGQRDRLAAAATLLRAADPIS